MIHPLRSIRWRIQLWYGVLLAVVTAALMVFFYQYARQAHVEEMDARLMTDFLRLLPQHLPPTGSRGGREGPPGAFDRSPPSGRPHLPPREGRMGGPSEDFEEAGKYILVYESDGSIRYQTDRAPDSPPPAPRASGTYTELRWIGDNRELVHVSSRGEAIVAGVPSGLFQEQMQTFALKLLAGAVVLYVFALVIGAWITNAALRPIRQIADTARKIAAGDWKQRIPTEGNVQELAGLGEVLNDSFDRIERSFHHQARFTADASHELGNPVSIILSQTELALDRPREAPEYVRALEACRRAGERMRDLTRDLLDLAGYEAGTTAQQRRVCDLREVVEDALSAVEDFANERNAVIIRDLQPVFAEVHARAISQALINLLNNAIKHNEPGVRIEIRLRAAGGFACLEVSDTGRGVPAEAHPHVFERFHRIDPSHRSTGRGLGLAIVRAIAEIHRGSVSLESSFSTGSRFVLRIPLKIDQPLETKI